MTGVREAFLDPEYGPAPESDRAATEWLEGGERAFGHYVGGEWTEGDGPLHETRCPADGRLLARFRYGTAEDVSRAVAAARAALAPWRDTDGHARARFLYSIARQLQRRSRLFAVLESLDNGKALRESRDLDVPLAVRHFYHHAGWAQLAEAEFEGWEAAGVAGQIVPWNFPLLMLAWKVAPALAAGCTVVLKPAEHTPLTALLFAEAADRAGLPPGVVNIVTGDGATGAALVRHPDVDKVAFTGSTEVGREIRRATAGTGKGLSLELGGKSPFVVFDNADLDAAVEGVVDGIWLNQGQVCCAGSRLLVQESVEEDVLARLRARMERLRVGHPLDKSTDMGAVVDASQLDRIEGYLEGGRADGAEVWQPSGPMPDGGLFLPPTLCTGAPPSSAIATEEVFGPVVVSLTFRTPAEAVSLANDTRYGLAASVWTEDVNLALDVAPAIKAGTVWINCTNLFDAASGFGGYRESGFGREGGREGMWEYLKPAARRVRAAGGGTGDELAAYEKLAKYDGRAARGGLAQGVPAEDPTGADAPLVAGSRSPEPIGAGLGGDAVDRTRKLWIGGRQARPDGGYSLLVRDGRGRPFAEVPRANRKDVRNAVEAARKAREAWAATSGHSRAQILYYVAENLAARAEGFAAALQRAAGDADADESSLSPPRQPPPHKDARVEGNSSSAATEVDAAVRALFTFAAWADKHDGRVHSTPFRNVVLAMNEPVGTVAIRCGDEAPLAGVAGPLAAALSQGNAVVLLAPGRFPVAALDLVQVLETSDVPPGVVNILSGLHNEIVPALAAHDDVDQLWELAGDDLAAEAERLSIGNLKRVWVDRDRVVDWTALSGRDCEFVLRQATRVKNVWVPYGV